MQLASLGSGSKGNATLVRNDQSCVLIDCGFSLSQFEKRLQRLAIDGQQIDAVLVTHEHSDHGAGVSRVADKYGIPLWMTVGTARALEIQQFEVINGDQAFSIGSLDIQAVTVPHDAAEPVQFVFTDTATQRRLGILTDSGHITSHMQQAYSGLQGLLLEFNYDEQMLEEGPYPPSLKRRIAGNHGHLSNIQSLQLLQQIDTRSLTRLIAGHISEKNNSVQIVGDLLRSQQDLIEAVIACQQNGFDWMDV